MKNLINDLMKNFTKNSMDVFNKGFNKEYKINRCI